MRVAPPHLPHLGAARVSVMRVQAPPEPAFTDPVTSVLVPAVVFARLVAV